MVTTIIKNDEGQEICRKLTSDEGKLIYNNADIAEIGESAIGESELIVPLEWDYERIYVEKEIPEEIDLNNIIEK